MSSASRSPMDRKIRSDRFSYRGAPYRRESSHQGFSQSNLCKNCKRPGHFARECPNVAICHNCGLPGMFTMEMEHKKYLIRANQDKLERRAVGSVKEEHTSHLESDKVDEGEGLATMMLFVD